MMKWEKQLRADPLPWLLEKDSPGVRYLALRDVVGLDSNDAELTSARRAAHRSGPIATILDRMEPGGYWVQPGSGYNPKYRSTVWSIIMLAQLGGSVREDTRIAKAVAYVLDEALVDGGQFTATGARSGTADCLQGNLCRALLDLGCEAERLDTAFDWMARTVTGEGLAPVDDRRAERRYYAGKCGPDFACGSNNKLPCAWGGVKVMLAFGALPPARRTPVIKRAIRRGIDFFLATDPVDASYPNGYASKPSGNWWKFGYPVFYVTDLLQNVQALVSLGLGRDPRLARSLEFIRGKQDDAGRWALDYDYAGKTWVDWGAKRAPNKWVTLRALHVLQAAG